jgi:hypothetical protein
VRKLVQFTFAGAGNFLLLLASMILLLLGPRLNTNVTAWIAVGLFLTWDALFLVSDEAFEGRDAENLLSQINQARAYLSALLPIYAGLLGAVFALEPNKVARFFMYAMEQGVRLPYILLPFVFSVSGLLFIPAQLRLSGRKETSSALRILLVWVAFCEKSAFFLFVHCILRLLSIFTRAI